MRLLTRGEWFVTAALHRFLLRMFDTEWSALCNRLILETDPPTIASRVSMRGAESDIPLTDRVTEVSPHNVSFFVEQEVQLLVCISNMATCTAGQHPIIPCHCQGAACKVVIEVESQ